MKLWDLAVALIVGLIAIDMYDWAGRVARMLIPIAARLWTRDTDKRTVYVEAWLADVNDCPAKISQFLIAISFLCSGIWRWSVRRFEATATTLESYIDRVMQRLASIRVSRRTALLISKVPKTAWFGFWSGYAALTDWLVVSDPLHLAPPISLTLKLWSAITIATPVSLLYGFVIRATANSISKRVRGSQDGGL